MRNIKHNIPSEKPKDDKSTSDLLFNMIPIYDSLNQRYKELGRELEENKKIIKDAMANYNLSSYEVGSITAKFKTQTKTDFDESKVMEILKVVLKNIPELLNTIIKTKQYVDYDELESAIYNGYIEASVLKPAQVTKSHTVLTIVKTKKGDADE